MKQNIAKNNRSNMYMMLTQDNRITDFRMNGNGRVGFADYIREIVKSVKWDDKIPANWILRYNFSKDWVADLQAKTTLQQLPYAIVKEAAKAKIVPLEVIPLPKAVFCDLYGYDPFSSLHKAEDNQKYVDFMYYQKLLRTAATAELPKIQKPGIHEQTSPEQTAGQNNTPEQKPRPVVRVLVNPKNKRIKVR